MRTEKYRAKDEETWAESVPSRALGLSCGGTWVTGVCDLRRTQVGAG